MTTQPTPAELAEIAVAHAASAHNACDVFAIVECDSRADLRWARNTLTTNGIRTTVSITIVAFAPTASGVATATAGASGPDADSIRDLVDTAVKAAQASPAADDAFELARDLHSGDWSVQTPTIDAAGLGPVSRSLGEVFASAQAEGREHFGYAEHGVETTWMASTTGVRRVFDQPSSRVEMTAKSHGRTRSAWQGAASESIATVDIQALDTRLRQSLGWQERRVDIPAGRHTAILSSGAVADLMCEFWWSATARDALEGRSVFSAPNGRTRLGERLTARALSISSDPADAFFTSAPFNTAGSSSAHASVFDNGLDTPARTWLDTGALATLINPRAESARNGLPAVASADCLRVEDAAGSGTLEDLVARTDDGLLVTCLWYNRVVDPQTLLLTGLTRDGVYVVRGGEIIGCTSNFRFNDSPVGLLARITDAGSCERTLPREMGDYVHRIAASPLVVGDFNFSTVSDAL